MVAKSPHTRVLPAFLRPHDGYMVGQYGRCKASAGPHHDCSFLKSGRLGRSMDLGPHQRHAVVNAELAGSRHPPSEQQASRNLIGLRHIGRLPRLGAASPRRSAPSRRLTSAAAARHPPGLRHASTGDLTDSLKVAGRQSRSAHGARSRRQSGSPRVATAPPAPECPPRTCRPIATATALSHMIVPSRRNSIATCAGPLTGTSPASQRLTVRSPLLPRRSQVARLSAESPNRRRAARSVAPWLLSAHGSPDDAFSRPSGMTDRSPRTGSLCR
jgi:hypothetical protein